MRRQEEEQREKMEAELERQENEKKAIEQRLKEKLRKQ